MIGPDQVSVFSRSTGSNACLALVEPVRSANEVRDKEIYTTGLS
jgi:hypothetical protein